MRPLLGVVAAAVLTLLSGCATPDPRGVEIVVAGAASLQDALSAAAARYEAAQPDVGVRFNFGASSALRTQIEQGAPMDLFASADTANPQALVDYGLSDGPVMPIARNHVVIAVARSSKTVIADPRDLAAPGVKLVAAAADVPITKYADQLVARLARLPGYPPDYVAHLAANTVSREDNVRAVVAKVALGEGDAGIVYATDVRGANVDTIEPPAGTSVLTTYGAVTIKASRHPAEAAAFLGWLAGPEGQAALGEFGFLPVAG